MSKKDRFTPEQGWLEESVKQKRSITADWEFLHELIEGVRVKEVKNVPKDNGSLIEIFRQDWAPDSGTVDQVFQVVLNAGAVSAWHAHQFTTDRIFINRGLMKLVLYDARQQSASYGRINEFRFGSARPALVVIPPGVWHGIHNISRDEGSILNLVDRAYVYEDPDHWRLPPDTKAIPYSFTKDRLL